MVLLQNTENLPKNFLSKPASFLESYAKITSKYQNSALTWGVFVFTIHFK
jgi:hypothetical protein